MPTKSLRRTLRTVALAIVAGAAFNVFVAWTIVILVDERLWFDAQQTHHDAPCAWPYAVPEGWPATAAHRSEYRRPGFDEYDWWARFPESRGRSDFVMEQARFGLPMRCLALGERYDTRHQRLTVLQRGLRYSDEVNRGLPLDPIWAGLLVNTATYAALILGLRKTVPCLCPRPAA